MTEKHVVRTSNGTDRRDGHHKSSSVSVSSLNKRERGGGGSIGDDGKSKSSRTTTATTRGHQNQSRGASLDTRSILICLVSAAAILSSFPFALVHLGGGDGEDVGWSYGRGGGGANRDALEHGHVVVRSHKSDLGHSKGAEKAVDFAAGEPIVRQTDGEEPPGGLWSNSTVLPRWMKDYFDWHREKRRRNGFDDDEDGKTRYLVVQCLAEFGKCGGLADRLKPMAFYVMYANQTERVLLIRWTRPCRLEEFLVPPAGGGVDWRVPTHLEGRIPNRSTIRGAKQARWNKKSNATIMTATLQSPDGGEMMFDEHAPKGYEFSRVFGEMFRCMFQLSRPLSDSVRTTMDNLGLVPGHYGTAHVRARYPTHWLQHRSVRDDGTGVEISAKTIDKDGGVAFEGAVRKTMIDIGINAITCAANLLLSSPSSAAEAPEPEVMVYFASDSHELTTYLLRDAESPFSSPTSQKAMATATNTVGRRVRLTALERSDEPLHLDTTTWRNHTPVDFYPAFEDLWILGLGRCTSFGMGGYGRFGLALSTNSTCRFNHRNYRGRIQRCERPHWLDESKEKAADAAG